MDLTVVPLRDSLHQFRAHCDDLERALNERCSQAGTPHAVKVERVRIAMLLEKARAESWLIEAIIDDVVTALNK